MEMTVSIAILAIIMVAIGQTFFDVNRSWARQKEMADLVSNSRWAVDFMVREIHRATQVNSNPGVLPAGRILRVRLPAPSAGYVWYWRGDNSSDGLAYGKSDYLYRGIGNNLLAAYNSRSQLANFLTDNLSGNPVFSYIPATGLVNIELTLSRNSRDYFIRSAVKPRN